VHPAVLLLFGQAKLKSFLAQVQLSHNCCVCQTPYAHYSPVITVIYSSSLEIMHHPFTQKSRETCQKY